MQRVYVIGDTHFGHAKVASARGFSSTEEHDAHLIQRWNSVVNPRDTVWHLGDVLFASNFKALESLNGLKKLVMGNHDRHQTAKYLEHFAGVYGSAEVKGALLTHIPVHQNQFSRFAANIHGHMHAQALEDRRYFCVSAERINLTPILLDDVIRLFGISAHT